MIHAASASLVLALSAQTGVAPVGDVTLHLTGDGRWSMECTFQTEDGEARRRARGRGLGSSERINAPGVVSGQCDYEVEDGARLQLDIVEGGDTACPFASMDMTDGCRTTIGGPATGRIDFGTQD